jgi:apolipoprotein D and lipocalin family protein
MRFAAIPVCALLLMPALTSFGAFAAGTAPEPARPVDAAGFYAGRWYEIGRTPETFNKGCVAGYTDYQKKTGGLFELDGCHDTTPDGKEETIGGALKILNPGANTKFTVAYHAMMGLVSITRENWVLDHGEDWAIMATPDLKTASLYTRDPHPAPALVERMTKQIKALGYAGELEFPAEAKP